MKYFKLSLVRKRFSNGVKIIGLVCLLMMWSVLLCPLISARMVRGEGIKPIIVSFLFNNRGQWVPREMLVRELELSDKEDVIETALRELESQGIIFSHSGLFIVPREKIVEEKFQDEIKAINEGFIYFYVPMRTVPSFKEEFLKYIEFLEKRYTDTFGEVGKTDFFQNFLPQSMLIYGDNIQGLYRDLRDLLVKSGEKIRWGELYLNDLTSIWREPIMEPKEIEERRLLQEQAPEVLENIVRRVNLSLLNNEFGDNVIGFLFFGTRVQLFPHTDSDLDIKIITKTAFSHEKEEIGTIKSKLKDLLSMLSIGEIDIWHGFSLDEKVKIHDFEDEAAPLFRRHGILKKSEYLIIAKSSELLGKILEKIEQLSEY